MNRRQTISFKVRDVGIGSSYPVFVQSMTNTDTHDIAATLHQISALQNGGANMVRVAVLDHAAVDAVREIIRKSPVPIIADIHFDYRLALEVMRVGIDGLRINPGNIGGENRFCEVIDAAKKSDTPIRIGVNSGSIEPMLLKKYGHPCPEAMVESLAYYVEIAESMSFDKMVLSVKASDVSTMIQANRMAAEALPYPLHLGVTEAGSPRTGTIKSAVGIGALLADGIGDTIRVSLTGDPLNELPVAHDILKSLGLSERGIDLVACPTCGRTQIELVPLLEQVEQICETIDQPLKIAVMGCAVNGPGEAKEADIGIAGGKGQGIIFRKGEIVARAKEDELLSVFKTELNKLLLEDSTL